MFQKELSKKTNIKIKSTRCLKDLLNNYGNKRTQVCSIDNAEELKIGDKIQIIEIQIGMGVQLKVERKNGDQFYIGALGSQLR